MKKKRFILGLGLALALGASTIVSATNLYGKTLTLYFSGDLYNPRATTETSYTTADINGRYREEHRYNSGNPTRDFKGVLYYRTAWYKPNEARDTSYNINGWNETYCNNGDEFKLSIEAYYIASPNNWTNIDILQYTK